MGKSGSLRDHPSELTESRNELLAIVSSQFRFGTLIPVERAGRRRKGACTSASASKARGPKS